MINTPIHEKIFFHFPGVNFVDIDGAWHYDGIRISRAAGFSVSNASEIMRVCHDPKIIPPDAKIDTDTIPWIPYDDVILLAFYGSLFTKSIVTLKWLEEFLDWCIDTGYLDSDFKVKLRRNL